MISAPTRSAFVARENRFPLFRIMLWSSVLWTIRRRFTRRLVRRSSASEGGSSPSRRKWRSGLLRVARTSRFLSDRRFREKINPLDKYWQAGFAWQFRRRPCRRNADVTNPGISVAAANVCRAYKHRHLFCEGWGAVRCKIKIAKIGGYGFLRSQERRQVRLTSCGPDAP